MLSVVNADGGITSGSLIDEIVREGARRMPAAALEAEVNQYIAELAAETEDLGGAAPALPARTVVRRLRAPRWSSSSAARPGCRPRR